MRYFTLLQWTGVLALLFNGAVFAQTKAFFTTGGTYQGTNNYVKVHTYDPVSGRVTAVDSALGDFSNTVEVDGDTAYAHIGRASGHASGGDVIYQYDIATMSRTDSIENVPGVQEMTVHENWLILTRGYPASDDLVLIYDKADLGAGPVYSSERIHHATSSLTTIGDTLFVSYTRNDTGHLAMVDLEPATPAYMDSVMFDTLSSGLGGLITDGDRIAGTNQVYDGFNLAYAGVTVYDRATDTHFTDTNTVGAGAPFLFRNDSIWAKVGAPVNIYHADDTSRSSLFSHPYTAAAYDEASGRYFFQNSDYFSFGNIVMTDADGNTLDSVGTPISGAALALYQDISTDVVRKQKRDEALKAYPVPFSRNFNVSLPGTVSAGQASLQVLNAMGQQVQVDHPVAGNTVTIDMDEHPDGLYWVVIRTDQKLYKTQVIKQ